MTEQYPCGVCKLEVNDTDDSVQCDMCDRWNHINWVEINKQKYEKLKKIPFHSTAHLACLKFHFLKLTTRNLKTYFIQQTLSNNPLHVIKKSNKEIKELMARFKQVNDLLDPSENLTSCDYYDVNDISKLRINENDFSNPPKCIILTTPY